MTSLVFPIHNAELILGASLQDLSSFFERLPLKMQFIFVLEPGSKNEQLLIRRFADKNSKFPVKIHVNPKKLGRGKSVLTGLDAAEGDLIIVGTADLSTPLAEYFNFIQEFLANENAQFIIGNRSTSKKKRGGFQPKTKRFFENVETEKLRSKGIKFADPTSPFFAIRKNVFRQIRPNITRIPNWFYLSGFIVPALNMQIPIIETPIHYQDSPSVNFKWWKALF